MPRGVRPPSDNQVKREDVAFLFPFFGIIVLTPPILNLFAVNRLVFGVPLEVVYLFTVWLGLIVGAMILARRSPFEGSKLPPETDNHRTRQERIARDM